MLETLHCRSGHDFTRERVRGKKPIWCPEHRPQTGQPTRVKRSKAVEAPQTGEAAPEAPKVVTGPENRADVTWIFESVTIPSELKRKLRYVEGELDKGREVSDINFLIKIRRELVIEANRAAKRSREAVYVPDLEDEAA